MENPNVIHSASPGTLSVSGAGARPASVSAARPLPPASVPVVLFGAFVRRATPRAATGAPRRSRALPVMSKHQHNSGLKANMKRLCENCVFICERDLAGNVC